MPIARHIVQPPHKLGYNSTTAPDSLVGWEGSSPIPTLLDAFGVSILGASNLVPPLFRPKLLPCQLGLL